MGFFCIAVKYCFVCVCVCMYVCVVVYGICGHVSLRRHCMCVV